MTFQIISVRLLRAEQTGLTGGEEDDLDSDHGDDPGPAPAPPDGTR